MDDVDAEILAEFLVESRENLDRLDSEFVALERDPSDRGRLAAIFRTVHTIKGTSGFFGFSRLESLTHTGEHLLSLLRDGKLDLTQDMTTALLELMDAVRRTLAVAEAEGHESEEDLEPLIARLAAFAQPDSQPEPVAALPEPVAALPEPAVQPPAEDLWVGQERRTGDRSAPQPVAEAPEAAPKAPPEAAAQPVPKPAPKPAAKPAERRGTEDRRGEERVADIAGTTVRVDVALLDKLLNLVGELVLTRNQVLQFASHAMDATFLTVTQRLNLLTTELQEGVMKTRMRPIESLWGKLPRLVRDVALACGREVSLKTEGGDTELDRTVIEAINDPLIHLVRNAIDHGIEPPGVRVAHGKPAEGRLTLRAFHEGGQVHVEISDDGAGIDADAVRRKAIERGVVTPDQAAALGDKEVTALIFQPGFSTSETITNVSGRGVGLDVVRSNIEAIGGSVDLLSRPGAGTTIRVRIPLTLAIIPVLLVDCAGTRFAIPQVNLLELVRLEGEQLQKAIEKIQGTSVYRLRGNLLPLVDLRSLLDMPAGEPVPAEAEKAYIVVLQADGRPFGLIVDGVSDTEEIVVKSLDKVLKRLNLYGGATILGDGSVALILDVTGVGQRAGVVNSGHAAERETVVEGASLEDAERDPLLLVAVGANRLAVPLGSVARLEEIPRASVERVGRQDVVQYRGQILPLIRVDEYLGDRAGDGADPNGPLQVIVSSEGEGNVGFVVDRILDVVDEPPDVTYRATRRGVLGSVVLQGKVTELLDVEGAVRTVGGRASAA